MNYLPFCQRLICFSILIYSTTYGQSQAEQPSLVDLVNPYIGTGGHGHTFVGPSLPFGMGGWVKLTVRQNGRSYFPRP